MLRIMRQIIKVGSITEPLPTADGFEQLGAQLKAKIKQRFQGSLAIRFVDAGSCNGCELEVHAANNAYYDIERFGVSFTASPRFADMLLVTGPVSINMKTALEMTYEAMPAPKLVLALGDCAANCGVFGQDNYAIAGSVADIIPVDAVVHGCPPTPSAIIQGILQVMDSHHHAG
ncbi:MAG: NADH-quinone oxidoreductase subunit NuoB [Mariprofundaceae bacterium]|nr:NADH-quinone oxidoreductase subunit NuoB [Mariprofundaceae bacterium]